MTRHGSDDVFRLLVGRLKIRHLSLLLQIEKLGSLTKVAEHIGTSQPAMTQALAELEDMFGTRLFERSAKGMIATRYGKAVLMRARGILNDLDLLTLDMEAVKSGKVAHLHIGAIAFVSGMKLSEAIQRTVPRDQGISVTIHGGTTRQLLQMLRDHSLDLVLARVPDPLDTHGLDYDVLYHQRPRLIASRLTAGRLGRRRLDWAQLQDMDWILGPRHTSMRKQVVDIFLKEGLAPPAPAIESYSSSLIGEIVATNDKAVSIVPAEIAEDLVRIAGVAVVPYSFEWALPPVALFTRANEQPRPINVAFATVLRELCNTDPPQVNRDSYTY